MTETLDREIKSLLEEGKGLVSKAEAEKRSLNEIESARFVEIEKRIGALKTEKDTFNRFAKNEEELRQVEKPKTLAEKKAEKPIEVRMGEFFQKVIKDVDRPMVESRISGMGEGIPSDGGFMVGTDFSQNLLSKTFASTQLWNKVTKLSLSGTSNSIAIPYVNETSRVDGSRQGGLLAYWKAEGTAPTATKVKLGQMKLTADKLIGLAYLTDELIADAGALGAYVMAAFQREFSFKLDEAVISGNGAGKPLGWINAPCVVSVTKETGQAADTIKFENVLKMYSRFNPVNAGSAYWVINRDCIPQLYSMSLAIGTGGVIPPNIFTPGQPDRLFGIPIIYAEQAKTLGDTGDINLVDLSQYLAIDKGGMQSAESIHVAFTTDETALRFTYRCAGQPSWESAVTPNSASANTLSPFVKLAERA